MDSRLIHWGRDKMAVILQTVFSNTFYWLKNLRIRIRAQWGFSLLMHKCITRPQCVNTTRNVKRITPELRRLDTIIINSYYNMRLLGINHRSDSADIKRWRHYCDKRHRFDVVMTLSLGHFLWVHDETQCRGLPGLILGSCPAKKRRRYKVTPSLTGWAQT